MKVELGFQAPPMKEQFPQLDETDALRFDQANIALRRLHIRRVLSEADFHRAIQRLANNICAAVEKATRR